MLHTTMASLTGCNNPNCRKHNRVNQGIKLELRYTDEKHDINLSVNVTSPPTITVSDVTVDLLEFLYLDDIPSEDVRLAGYTHNGGYCTLNIKDTQITLQQLKMSDGCILHFEPTRTAPPPKPCQLIIIGPDEVERMNYEWYRAKTTLGMLLKYVIEKFSLQSVERERIHLITIINELDFFSHSNKRLSNFNLHSGMLVHVQIIPPLSPTTNKKNKIIHVQCTYDENQFDVDVPDTESIGELKTKIEEQFEGRQIIDFKLCNETNEELHSNESDRTLKSFGVKPGQTVFATFRLIMRNADEPPRVNNQSGTSTKSSLSSITKQKYDKITVICKFPSRNPESFQIPVTNTVNQVINRVESLITNQRLVISKMSTDKINIDFKKETKRCLADMELKKADTITVILADRSPTYASIVSRGPASSPKPEKQSKTRHISKMPIGLDNLGNSCYMNSALQCLAHVPQLTSMFLEGMQHAHMEDGEHTDKDWNPYDQVGEVTGAYAELLWYLYRCDENSDDYGSFKPSRVKERVGNKDVRFATDDQQDAQEFMTFFLNIIHEELKAKNKNQRNTIIKQLFFGEITSTITCTACNQQESTKHPISFLSIPLNRQERRFWIQFISKDGKDELRSVEVPISGRVEHVVDEFSIVYGRPALFYHILAMIHDGELDFKTSLSEIPTDEFVFMEQEDRLRDARPERLKLPQKKSTLVDCLGEFFSPEILEDEWTCPQEGCKKKVSATKQLKLCTLPTVLIIQFKRFSHENGFHQKVETRVEYPIEGLNLNRILPSLEEEAIYDLVAVSNHMGSISGGHYIAYARNVKANKKDWYKFDDSSVMRVEPDDYHYEIISRNAYLLFYIKRDTSKQVTEV